jgi:hypothetical protein
MLLVLRPNFAAADVHWSIYVLYWVVAVAWGVQLAIISGGTNACSIIAQDQIDQCIASMWMASDHDRGLAAPRAKEELGEPGLGSTELRWDFDATMADVFEIFEFIVPMCARGCVGAQASMSITFLLASDILVVYGVVAGHFGYSLGVNVAFTVPGFMAIFLTFYNFTGAVSLEHHQVHRLANKRERPSRQAARSAGRRSQSSEDLIAYLKDLNNGQSHGYCVSGFLVAPRAVWGACATVMTMAFAVTTGPLMELA